MDDLPLAINYTPASERCLLQVPFAPHDYVFPSGLDWERLLGGINDMRYINSD